MMSVSFPMNGTMIAWIACAPSSRPRISELSMPTCSDRYVIVKVTTR